MAVQSDSPLVREDGLLLDSQHLRIPLVWFFLCKFEHSNHTRVSFSSSLAPKTKNLLKSL